MQQQQVEPAAAKMPLTQARDLAGVVVYICCATDYKHCQASSPTRHLRACYLKMALLWSKSDIWPEKW